MSEAQSTLEQPAQVPSKRLYTYDDLVSEFPETTQPCELWDGELLIMPAPSFEHQEIVLRFYRALFDWVSQRQLGKVVTAPLDMVLSPHRATQPDVLFIAQDRLHIIQRVVHGPADLVVEVISLGSRNRDRIEKRDLYEQYGIKEYWIIDPEAKTVEALFLEAGHFRLFMRCSGDQRIASRLLAGFELNVKDIFPERA